MILIWEYLFCVLDILLLNTICDLFLVKKKIKYYWQFFLFLLSAFIVFVLTYENIFNYFSEIIAMIMIIVYISFIHQGIFYKKCLTFLLYYISYAIYNSLLMGAIWVFSESIGKEIYEYNSPIRIGFILFTRGLAYLILYYLNKKNKVQNSEYLFTTHMFYMAGISLIIVIVITNMLFKGNFALNIDYYILLLCLIFLLIFFIVTQKKMYDNKIKFKGLEVTAQALQMQSQFLEIKNEHEKEIRRIKHDLKNNLMAIEMLLKEQKYQDVEHYINEITKLPSLKKVIATGNNVLDALLNINVQMNPDIHFIIDVEVSELKIEKTSIAILVGNAINNAIEALKKNETEDKILKIEIKEKKKYIKMKFENTYEKEPILENGILLTSKKDAEEHGIGIMSMKKEAEKCNGKVVFDIHKEEKKFTLSILIQNNQKNVK